jgi:hypothetical protein
VVTTKKHEHHWRESRRGMRWCNWHVCHAFQYLVEGVWRDRMSAAQFADKWLPKIAGPTPEQMMTIDTAVAFEWNSYESWDVVFRVRFDFEGVTRRTQAGLGTRVDIMNGWRSNWHQDFCEIDAEAEAYYKARTTRDYAIGDDCYAQMRAIIQHGEPAPREPPKLVP